MLAFRLVCTGLLLAPATALLATVGCGPAISAGSDAGTQGGASGGMGTDDSHSATAADSRSEPGNPTEGPGSTTGPSSDPIPPPPPESTSDGGDRCFEDPPPSDGSVQCQDEGDASMAVTLVATDEPYVPETLNDSCIASLEDAKQGHVILLDCETSVYRLSVVTTPPMPAPVEDGQNVTLTYHEYGGDEVNIDWAVSLRGEFGNLLFAAFEGAEPPVPQAIDLAPLAFSMPLSSCEPELNGCLSMQTTGLRVSYDDGVAEVPWVDTFFSGTSGQIGVQDAYAVVVDTATRLYCAYADCGWNENPWRVRAGFGYIPEG